MRRSMKERMAAISPEDLRVKSAQASQRLQQTSAWAWMDTLFSFLSMPGELATEPLIRAALARGKSVAVPKIEGNDIRFVFLPPNALEPGAAAQIRDRWGIPVPGAAWPAADPARGGKVLVCAPGLAFDRRGNRLGRGKGYYDRFLSRARVAGSGLVTIGICFSEQVVDEVPHGEADQRLDGLVTDSEIVLFRSAGSGMA